MNRDTRVTKSGLLRLTQAQLDALYLGLESRGATPTSDTRGTVLALPGTRVGGVLRGLARLVVWQGKVFSPGTGDLKNKITPFRFKSIRAMVYAGASWMDDREATIIDYSKTSLVARWIRDEIREVAPGLWLGKVFIGRWHAIDFVLEG